MQVLNATALGVVIALIPNAIFGEFLKPFNDLAPVKLFLQATVLLQLSASFLIGVLMAYFLQLNPMKIITVGAATFVASGVVKFTQVPVVDANHVYTGMTTIVQARGIGDLINAMLVAAYTSYFMLRVKDVFGSLSIILIPTLGGALCGAVGIFLQPYVGLVTKGISTAVAEFTHFTPMLASLLIGAVFAVMIVSPVSTVVVALAVQLTPEAAGYASVGISGTYVILFIKSFFLNKPGVTIAIGFGAVKMMVPNLFKYPIMALPLAIMGAVGGFSAYALGILSDAQKAGFGFAGLIGPINAYKFYGDAISSAMALVNVVAAYFLIPAVAAFMVNFVLSKVLKLYGNEIFTFNPEAVTKGK